MVFCGIAVVSGSDVVAVNIAVGKIENGVVITVRAFEEINLFSVDCQVKGISQGRAVFGPEVSGNGHIVG